MPIGRKRLRRAQNEPCQPADRPSLSPLGGPRQPVDSQKHHALREGQHAQRLSSRCQKRGHAHRSRSRCRPSFTPDLLPMAFRRGQGGESGKRTGVKDGVRDWERKGELPAPLMKSGQRCAVERRRAGGRRLYLGFECRAVIHDPPRIHEGRILPECATALDHGARVSARRAGTSVVSADRQTSFRRFATAVRLTECHGALGAANS